MALFFTRPTTIAEAARPRLRAAHLAAAQTEDVATASTDQDVTEIGQATRPTFSVPRFCCAALFVIVLFALYYLSAHDPKMGDHSDALFNLFQILTTGLTGLLVGEASASTSAGG
jgi:hypothetical protein